VREHFINKRNAQYQRRQRVSKDIARWLRGENFADKLNVQTKNPLHEKVNRIQFSSSRRDAMPTRSRVLGAHSRWTVESGITRHS
jgi:hypothetical protein